ncbi:hypothetical protein [Lacinutrix himadriensis]|uniref:hypothetical protein n=1 Tax=Lacinutrix himadriensis TaxID=641549 RepID=UPI0006E351CB|nr:hypothetical protein [Lacinutrix himadriensis]
MKVKIVIILLLAFVFGCNTENKKGQTKTKETKEISLLDTLQLRLNHGNKWLANPETQGGVVKMNAMIEAFKTETNKDYNALGKKLAKQTSYIIKNCSMVGEPHDQLHVVLVPMLDEISNLKEAKNNTEGEASLAKLEGLIKDYFLYFKL